MFIEIDREGTVEGLRRLIQSLSEKDDVSGIMILSCDGNGFIPQRVDKVLIECSKPIFGGIFPQIIYEKERLYKGTIAVGIKHAVKTIIIKAISDHETDFDKAFEDVLDCSEVKDKTVFVFVDGLSKRIGALNDGIFNSFGLLPNYIGGGAGSITFQKKPCIFTSRGLIEDGAVLAFTDMKSGIGVAHGWKPVSEPMKVTGTDRNTVISLNWRPAFDVYRETIKSVSGKTIDKSNFFEIAKEFPLGIIRMADEMVVRDPVAMDNGNIICVGEVPRDSFIYILKGDKESLLEGTAKARDLAGQAQGSFTFTFFIDCISRVMYLKSDFEEELELVYNGKPLVGALTLGEIANTGKSYLEFYNKTSVVGLMEG